MGARIESLDSHDLVPSLPTYALLAWSRPCPSYIRGSTTVDCDEPFEVHPTIPQDAGKSLSEFVNQVRLQAVCEELRNTSRPVGTIALNDELWFNWLVIR